MCGRGLFALLRRGGGIVATRFKYLPSVRKSYAEQGKIFFDCQNYSRQPAEIRAKIDELIQEAGGEYADALRAYLCTRASWERVTMECFVSSATLDRIRRKFFELW